jgi:hypothetical protein
VVRKKIGMAAKILGLIAITILLSSVLVLALSSDQVAEAKKAATKVQYKYSKWSGKVCGDQLCPEKDFTRTKQFIGKSRTPR